MKLLPEEVVKVGIEMGEADQNYNVVWQKYNKAKQKFNEVIKKHSKELEALHKKECGCREWSNGQLNFRGVK